MVPGNMCPKEWDGEEGVLLSQDASLESWAAGDPGPIGG